MNYCTRVSFCRRTIASCRSHSSSKKWPTPLQPLALVSSSFCSSRNSAAGSPSRRSLSTSTSAGAKSTTKNPFLDHLGSIFLGSIGLIIGWLVRSYYNTKNRNLVRDEIELSAALDPIELDELKQANSEFTTEQYKKLQNLLLTPQSDDRRQNEIADSSVDTMSYQEFVEAARAQLISPLQLGHLVDRVAITALSKQNKSTRDPMPVAFWLILVLPVVNCSAADRIGLAYDTLIGNPVTENSQSETSATKASIDGVIEVIQHLQDSCQLVPDAQVVATSHKFPLQEYTVGSASDLVDRQQFNKDSAEVASSADDRCEIDADAFAAILRSKSVCAWGECYHKKKFA